MAQRRSLVLLVLALMLGCLGCRYGRDEDPVTLSIPRWTADLPGNSEVIELQLPVHLDGRLPRIRVKYTLRSTVDLPATMRGRALTLAVPHMPAMASLRVDGAEAVPIGASGFIFLVMELVKGGTTLHDVRKRHHDVPWTLGVLASVAEGLDAIHAAGIVHRDLKPGNILLSRGADGRRPDVKITDSQAPRFEQVCPALGPEIAALLDRAMSHDPRARPAARELAAALRATAERLLPPASRPASSR